MRNPTDREGLAEAEPQEFSVLTCSGEPYVSEAAKLMIQCYLGPGFRVVVADRSGARCILDYIKERQTHLVFAMVNNIVLPSERGHERIRKALALLGQIKREFGIPVIAFSAFEPPGFSLPDLLRENGITQFFWAPYLYEDLRYALKAELPWIKT